MNTRLMAHMLPFYPDRARSMRVAEALVDAGADYLEVQFPFSDPSADGPTIQAASAVALERGFSIAAGWRFVAELVERFAVPVFVMSYASPVFTRGVPDFVAAATDAGAAGLIVPDLPIDADEGLYAATKRAKIAAVPVTAFGALPSRLKMIADLDVDYVYASIRRGITGTATSLSDVTHDFIARAARVAREVFAGFGIQRREQVETVCRQGAIAVVGSALVRSIDVAGADPYTSVFTLCSTLSGRRV